MASTESGAAYTALRASSGGRGPLSAWRHYLTQEIMPSRTLHEEDGDGSTSPHHLVLSRNAALHNEEQGPSLPGGGVGGNLGGGFLGSLLRELSPGSQRAGTLTLVATALGSGVLALPFAFSQVGIVLGLLLLTIAASLSCLSLIILMIAARYAERTTFASLLALATTPLSGLALDACLVVYGVAVLLALLIFEGDFVPAVLEAFPNVPNPGRNACIIGVALTAWPLVLPMKVSALRYIAAFSPFAILFMAGNIVVQAPSRFAGRPEGSVVELWNMQWDHVLRAASIFIFSMMCHSNAVPAANMLDRPSVARIVKVTMYGQMLCWALYSAIGVGGYLSFQAAVKGDFLLNYPIDSVPILCCRVMLSLVCFVGIPMNSSPCAQAIRNVVTAIATRGKQLHADENPLLHGLLATGLLATATAAALCLHDVAMVLGIIGGSLATLQMFWLPALIYWRLLYATQPSSFRRYFLGGLVAAGIVGFTTLAAQFL